MFRLRYPVTAGSHFRETLSFSASGSAVNTIPSHQCRLWSSALRVGDLLKPLTFGQVQPQQPREAHRRHAGVELGRRLAQELVGVWNRGSRWKRCREGEKVDEGGGLSR